MLGRIQRGEHRSRQDVHPDVAVRPNQAEHRGRHGREHEPGEQRRLDAVACDEARSEGGDAGENEAVWQEGETGFDTLSREAPGGAEWRRRAFGGRPAGRGDGCWVAEATRRVAEVAQRSAAGSTAGAHARVLMADADIRQHGEHASGVDCGGRHRRLPATRQSGREPTGESDACRSSPRPISSCLACDIRDARSLARSGSETCRVPPTAVTSVSRRPRPSARGRQSSVAGLHVLLRAASRRPLKSPVTHRTPDIRAF